MVCWNKSTIAIDFNSESVNDRTMSLIISNENKIWKFLPMPQGRSTWTAEITLPTKLSLEFGGKRSNDTLVDNDGNIIKNMTVDITSLKLDGIPCWQYWCELSTILELDHSNDLLLGKTISDNGKVDFLFEEDNAFFWLTKSKHSNHFQNIKEFAHR